MSIEADSIEHEREIESDNEQIINLLKALIVGIAIIANKEPHELIEMSEEI